MTKGEQTRQKIVQAAAPIFNQSGYDGSSLNDLMVATGLQKGGIYRHFASKEELAAEAFDYTWEAVWNARLLHVDEKANGIDKLKKKRWRLDKSPAIDRFLLGSGDHPCTSNVHPLPPRSAPVFLLWLSLRIDLAPVHAHERLS